MIAAQRSPLNRFVTAFNGSRDYYEVPLALHELDLLERHVSDVYLPDALVPPARRLYPRALRRYRRGLPSSKVHRVARAFLPQLTQMLRHRVKPPGGYDAIDRALSLEAARISGKTGSNLFLHSGCALWAFERHPDRRRWLYQFHPHPLSVYEILEKDFAAHPEVRVSFETEIDSQDPSNLSDALLSEWRLADHIFCASTFTAKSLILQGCDPVRIHVVPYGNFAQTPQTSARERPTRCRFLFVGQGVQRKGIHHLLKAWKLAALGLLGGCELHVVARNIDPGLLPLLEQPGVHFHHRAADELRDRMYATSNVFVMPSLVEGFGLVYLEALSFGLHCIGTVHTGLPDLHPPSEIATIVEAGDVAGLAAALARSYELWRRDEFDRPMIARFARRRSWADHRAEMKSVVQLLTH